MSNGPRRSARRRPASVEPGSTRRKQNRTGARVRIRPLPRSQKMQLSSCRGSRIRTCGPLLPKQVLYQAELCPEPRFRSFITVHRTSANGQDGNKWTRRTGRSRNSPGTTGHLKSHAPAEAPALPTLVLTAVVTAIVSNTTPNAKRPAPSRAQVVHLLSSLRRVHRSVSPTEQSQLRNSQEVAPIKRNWRSGATGMFLIGGHHHAISPQ